MLTFKVLSALLSYPEAELCAAVPEMRRALDGERLIPAPQRAALDRFLDEVETGDLYDLQERYVQLFDRSRTLSLHIFEHVHGESRDRGQAMIDLGAIYQQGGLAMRPGELPDFLPLLLEYCSTLPLDTAREFLGQPAHILAALAERLRKRESSYEWVLRAIGAIAAAELRKADLDAIMSEQEADPNDFAALDAAWEEEAVSFGPGAGAQSAIGGCGTDALAARMRHAKRAVSTADNPLSPGAAS
ncbi:nitrate reductase [Rhodopseudomonas palustris]|uniref:Nitrate reductase n=1 Tax=Rhodopseudomonas palustris TaxID=1076 RepID=A0A0D7F428_RHOPL|nr:nitrate reductase [Rhodopseudomonas palustris]